MRMKKKPLIKKQHNNIFKEFVNKPTCQIDTWYKCQMGITNFWFVGVIISVDFFHLRPFSEQIVVVTR